MLTNYHTHNTFCDGQMLPEAYVISAIQKGFKALGFSSHTPVSFETGWTMKEEDLHTYIETILMLKEQYKDQIQIYLGLETNYYPGCRDYRNIPDVDYTIGAVHFIHDPVSELTRSFDGSAKDFYEAGELFFGGNIRSLVEAYYNLLIEMMQNQTPEILGHIDVLKKNNVGNRFFNESELWYKNLVEKTLIKVKKHNIIVEINTGGISRGYTTEMYPSSWIISLMHEMDIPIMLNSDAHHPDWIDTYYAEAKEVLTSVGYHSQRILIDGLWQDVPLC